MRGNRELGIPGQLLLYCFYDVVRHERFTIVLSDVPVRYEAGFTAQIAGELTAVIVLHDDGVPRTLENVENGVAMQRNQPSDLKLVGGNALPVEDLAGLFDHAFGGSPADQGDVSIRQAP